MAGWQSHPAYVASGQGPRPVELGGAVGGLAQGARRPQLCEDGGLGQDRTRRPAGQALTPMG